jgi:uncharacterized membrane protein
MQALSITGGALLYRALMLAASVWCHQMPERSPHLWGVQLPLCWRCTGILCGAVMLAVVLIVKKKLFPLTISIIFALLMPLDVYTTMLGLRTGDNVLRFLTGILWGIFGTTLALYLLRWIVAFLKSQSSKRQAVEGRA